MTQKLMRTKAQLKSLDYPYIGIQLKDGSKIFGPVHSFTANKIYVTDTCDPKSTAIDVPRRIIARAFLLIKGDKYDD